MEILDTGENRAPAAAAAPGREKQVSIDRFEAVRRFEEREEEEKVEAAMALYEKAARARMPDAGSVLGDSGETEEEREARSQRLKLQQKCQDIAALMMVDELEDGLDEEEG